MADADAFMFASAAYGDCRTDVNLQVGPPCTLQHCKHSSFKNTAKLDLYLTS
eukprot:jgi/Psemu1/65852/estExt_Genemark1.C_1570085